MTDIPKAKTEAEWRQIWCQNPEWADFLSALREHGLILSDPESDLLKEAREICARVAEERGMGPEYADGYRTGSWDNHIAMRCTLAALKHRKDG